jgi:hypothetical protein
MGHTDLKCLDEQIIKSQPERFLSDKYSELTIHVIEIYER